MIISTKEKRDYYILDPAGNITALIPAQTLEECTIEHADQIMAQEPEVEQAGYLLPGGEEADLRLQMAGGEFCGNATLSAASLYCYQTGLPIGTTVNLKVRVSGAPGLVRTQITRESENTFAGSITMPQIDEIQYLQLPCITSSPDQENHILVPVVRATGIAHCILDEDLLTDDQAEALIKDWCQIIDIDALGIMRVDKKYTRISPLVYVRTAGTLFHEHSCASGSAATANYLAAQKHQPITCTFKEPGGTIRVTAQPHGEIVLYNRVTLKC